MSVQTDQNNLVVREDESEFEDFDGDDTMENMLDLFIFHRKDACFLDWFSFLSFIVFLCVNVGCVSFNLYKAITSDVDDDHDMFAINTNSSFTNIYNSTSSSDTGIIIDRPTKILYITEFIVILTFALLAIYHFIQLSLHPNSKSALSNAANFTRLVREFSCFSLVPLFNVNTIMGIYSDIAQTFDEERKKYADRSKLWDGIWGMGTKDVQKTNAALELVVENQNNEVLTKEQQDNENTPEESGFKKFKHSKTFLHLVSFAIFAGFFVSIMALIFLAFFAFVALYIKTRHVGNFIIRNDDFFYKWFNFITFIMNIASLSQQSPAIKLIIYQLKILTRKAHHNNYRRRKQNRIKANGTNFDANKDEEGIQAPKIIIHRKRISKTVDDAEVEEIDEEDFDSLDADKINLKPPERRNSKLSTKSANSL